MNKMRRKGRFHSDETLEVTVARLTPEGHGWAEGSPKPLTILRGLAGESILAKRVRPGHGVDIARVIEVTSASPDRVEPPCANSDVCNGCTLLHASAKAQLEHKEGLLRDDLARRGVVVGQWLAPLTGPTLGYRRRARLGVRWVEKKGKLLVGFHEAVDPRFVADISSCEVLDERVGHRLEALAQLVAGCEIYRRLPQIEVSCADHTVALTFRVLGEIGAQDRQRLAAFGQEQGWVIALAHDAPKGVELIAGEQHLPLTYAVDDDTTLQFELQDFVQVNAQLNRKMVARVLELLDLAPSHRVLDLFCGLGNFTLPIAKHCATVLGVEGDKGLVQRAVANARRNGRENAQFETRDLYKQLGDASWLRESFDRVLLDPPRSGALEIVSELRCEQVEKVVYVSCNPETLARDAQVLTEKGGFELAFAGIMDMFPHTGHVESLAVFVRPTSS